MDKSLEKRKFKKILSGFTEELSSYVSTQDNQWAIKGFIDVFKNIYSISKDTKIISKILEIHIFPKFLKFAEDNNYNMVLAEHQNWYPDLSFVNKSEEKIKFAVDLKTTYRNPKNSNLCNGFTLGSHGAYFVDRNESKNIQFPYNDYLAHYCLGIIYSRNEDTISETKIYPIDDIKNINSVIKNFQFFVAEKWTIASDKQGSGNTANIGSIKNISDIIAGNGCFKNYGEEMFDDYWMNYGKITIKDDKGNPKIIKRLEDYLKYRKILDKNFEK